MGDNMMATIFQYEITPPDAISPSIRAVEPSCIVPTVVGDSSLKISKSEALRQLVVWGVGSDTMVDCRQSDGRFGQKTILDQILDIWSEISVDQACRSFAPSQAHRLNLLLTKPNVTPTKKGYFMTWHWRGLRLVRNSLERVMILKILLPPSKNKCNKSWSLTNLSNDFGELACLKK